MSCALALCGTVAHAQLVSGYWGYSVGPEPGTGQQVVTIREYKGSGGFAVVPASIDGLPVRTVGGGLGQLDRFNTNKITGIEIPDSVTTISAYAFWQCTALTNAVIGNAVATTGFGSFAYCSALTNVSLPNSLAILGDYAFYRATALTNLSLGSGLRSIGVAALSDSPKLKALVIPEGVTNIGNFAFNNNTGLISVLLPHGLTTIGNHAFGNNDGLTNLVIPDSVTAIGSRAFEQTAMLSNVVLGQDLVSIGAGAFWIADAVANTVIPDGVTELPEDLFFDCLTLSSVVVGTGVTNVRPRVFAARSNLASVVFKGNAPSLVNPVVTNINGVTITNYLAHTNVFGTNSFPTVFFLPGATGWGALFAGRSTAPFVPVAAQSGFVNGVGFAFTWSGTSQVPMNVQRRGSLVLGDWDTVARGVTNGGFVDTGAPLGAAYYRSVLP